MVGAAPAKRTPPQRRLTSSYERPRSFGLLILPELLLRMARGRASERVPCPRKGCHLPNKDRNLFSLCLDAKRIKNAQSIRHCFHWRHAPKTTSAPQTSFLLRCEEYWPLVWCQFPGYVLISFKHHHEQKCRLTQRIVCQIPHEGAFLFQHAALAISVNSPLLHDPLD